MREMRARLKTAKRVKVEKSWKTRHVELRYIYAIYTPNLGLAIAVRFGSWELG